MEESKAVELMQALGVNCSIGSETYEAMLEHPTVKAFLDGELSISEAVFVEEYLGNGFNATKAAQAARYSARTRGGFSTVGGMVLKKPKIKALVARRVAERALNADEVLDRYREVADGTIEDYIGLKEIGDFVAPNIDLEKAKREGRLHLLKEVKIGKDGDIAIKMRDQDHALDQLARSLGVFEKDNTLKLPPEVLALLSLSQNELAGRKSAYESMEDWDDKPAEQPGVGGSSSEA